MWGFCEKGSSVSVSFNGNTIQATVSEWLGTRLVFNLEQHVTIIQKGETTWIVKLPATDNVAVGNGFKTYDIVAISGGEKIGLSSVMFGDVWVVPFLSQVFENPTELLNRFVPDKVIWNTPWETLAAGMRSFLLSHSNNLCDM